MEVCFLASGETVAVLDAHDFEGKSARNLKQALAARVGVSRFRQRFFLEGDSDEISDDMIFSTVPIRVQLVVLDFLAPDDEQDEAMIRACEENDLHALNQLLLCPRNPNVKGKHGLTALSTAAWEHHLEIAWLLCEAGAVLEDSDNVTELLIRTAEVGDVELAQFLLEAGAAPNQTRRDGDTPLLVAAQQGHVDIARLLLEAGAAFDQGTVNGASPLLVAAVRGSVDVAGLLLEASADPDQARNDGVTPLLVAASQGDVDLARLLIQAGASPDRTRFFSGETKQPSHVEIQSGLRQYRHRMPLLAAIRQGHLDIVRLLLEAGTVPNLSSPDGTTPLLVAVREGRGRVNIVRLLLEARAAPEQARNDGETSLFIAAVLGHLDIARMLLEAGAASDQVRKDGATPLFIAARQGHFDIARLLLESGASIDLAQDFASSHGYAAAVARLEQLAAETRVTSKDDLQIDSDGLKVP